MTQDDPLFLDIVISVYGDYKLCFASRSFMYFSMRNPEEVFFDGWDSKLIVSKSEDPYGDFFYKIAFSGASCNDYDSSYSPLEINKRKLFWIKNNKAEIRSGYTLRECVDICKRSDIALYFCPF